MCPIHEGQIAKLRERIRLLDRIIDENDPFSDEFQDVRIEVMNRIKQLARLRDTLKAKLYKLTELLHGSSDDNDPSPGPSQNIKTEIMDSKETLKKAKSDHIEEIQKFESEIQKFRNQIQKFEGEIQLRRKNLTLLDQALQNHENGTSSDPTQNVKTKNGTTVDSRRFSPNANSSESSSDVDSNASNNETDSFGIPTETMVVGEPLQNYDEVTIAIVQNSNNSTVLCPPNIQTMSQVSEAGKLNIEPTASFTLSNETSNSDGEQVAEKTQKRKTDTSFDNEDKRQKMNVDSNNAGGSQHDHGKIIESTHQSMTPHQCGEKECEFSSQSVGEFNDHISKQHNKVRCAKCGTVTTKGRIEKHKNSQVCESRQKKKQDRFATKLE